MIPNCLPNPHRVPEWRRSGRFLLLALVLHGIVLLCPLPRGHAQVERPAAPMLLARLMPPAFPPSQSSQPTMSPRAMPPPMAAARRQGGIQAPRAVIAVASPSPAALPVSVAPVLPIEPAPTMAPVAESRPTSPAPSAAAALSPARFDVAYLNNPRPDYPAISRRLGEEGRVLLRVRVTAEGLPATVDIETGSNFNRLDEAARRVVSRWRFVPARRGEEAIEATVTVPIVFRLEE